MNKYYLSENNSGGYWWLNHNDYNTLLANGWKLREGWDKKTSYMDPTKPWDNRDTTPYGYRHNLYFEAKTEKEAIASFEANTGQDFYAEGCSCCGAPFYISTYE